MFETLACLFLIAGIVLVVPMIRVIRAARRPAWTLRREEEPLPRGRMYYPTVTVDHQTELDMLYRKLDAERLEMQIADILNRKVTHDN